MSAARSLDDAALPASCPPGETPLMTPPQRLGVAGAIVLAHLAVGGAVWRMTTQPVPVPAPPVLTVKWLTVDDRPPAPPAPATPPPPQKSAAETAPAPAPAPRPTPAPRPPAQPVIAATPVPRSEPPARSAAAEAPPAPAPQPAPAPAPAIPPAPPSPPAPAAPPAPPRLLPDSAVGYLERPAPVYPEASKRLGETGTVVVRALIDPAGHAQDVAVQRSSGHPRLDNAAVDAVRRARFRPYLDNGVAVPVRVTIPLNFELED